MSNAIINLMIILFAIEIIVTVNYFKYTQLAACSQHTFSLQLTHIPTSLLETELIVFRPVSCLTYFLEKNHLSTFWRLINFK